MLEALPGARNIPFARRPPRVARGEDLRRLRDQHGITLTQAAQALGTSTSKVSNIERSIYHDTAFSERNLERLTPAESSAVQKAA